MIPAHIDRVLVETHNCLLPYSQLVDSEQDLGAESQHQRGGLRDTRFDLDMTSDRSYLYLLPCLLRVKTVVECFGILLDLRWGQAEPH